MSEPILLTLGKLTEKHDHIPATTEVINGFYGNGSQFEISAGDQLCVPFAKNKNSNTSTAQGCSTMYL